MKKLITYSRSIIILSCFLFFQGYSYGTTLPLQITSTSQKIETFLTTTNVGSATDVTVTLPAGYAAYSTTTGVDLTALNSTLQSQITSLTIKATTGTVAFNMAGIKIPAATAALRTLIFQNLSFTGTISGYFLNTAAGNLTDLQFQNCTLTDYRGGILFSATVAANLNITNITFDNCILKNIKDYGLVNFTATTKGTLSKITITNSSLYGQNDGIQVSAMAIGGLVDIENSTLDALDQRLDATGRYVVNAGAAAITVRNCILGRSGFNDGIYTSIGSQKGFTTSGTITSSGNYYTTDWTVAGNNLSGMTAYTGSASALFNSPTTYNPVVTTQTGSTNATTTITLTAANASIAAGQVVTGSTDIPKAASVSSYSSSGPSIVISSAATGTTSGITLSFRSQTTSLGDYSIKDASFAGKASCGDPRWYYPVSTTLGSSSLSGLNYSANGGPSSAQTFTLSALALRTAVTVTAPTDYEVSTDGTTYVSSLTLGTTGADITATSIYVRLKSGLAEGSYNNENITISTTGTANKTVSCSGNVSAPATLATDYFRSKASGNSADLTSWESSSDNTTWISATALPTAAATAVTILDTHTLAVNAHLSVSNLTVNAGATVNVNAGIQLTVSTAFTNNGTLNLFSDATSTATILTPATIGGSGTANVQQYLTAGRNWYMSSPVATAPVSSISNASKVYSFDESTAAGTWSEVTTGSLTPMQGYVAAVDGTSGVVTFSGALNTGTIANSTTLSGTDGNTNRGYNLVGNPYPSYVNWEMATITNLEPSIWYRTLNSSNTYVFDTYNTEAHIGTSNNNDNNIPVTANIAPMQAIWVRVIAGTNATVSLDNSMRSHQDQAIANNRLKAPAENSNQVVRLQVSNGKNSDQAIVMFNAAASNSYDKYDSRKMPNNNPGMPELYTTAGSENVVINGLSSLKQEQEIAVGFTTAKANTFTLKATEISNFEPGTRIILKDKLLNTEQELTIGSDYSFTSDVVSNSSRFSIVFKAASVATAVNNANDIPEVSVYRNANNQIAIDCTRNTNSKYLVSVYNALGQTVEVKQITGSVTLIGKSLASGVYMVTVNNGNTSTTQRVILN